MAAPEHAALFAPGSRAEVPMIGAVKTARGSVVIERAGAQLPAPPGTRVLAADRVRTGLLNDDMIASRSKARGVSELEYMGGNLLGLEVTAEDVAQAFVSLAKATKTTGAVVTVDGGNIAAALR